MNHLKPGNDCVFPTNFNGWLLLVFPNIPSRNRTVVSVARPFLFAARLNLSNLVNKDGASLRSHDSLLRRRSLGSSRFRKKGMNARRTVSRRPKANSGSVLVEGSLGQFLTMREFEQILARVIQWNTNQEWGGGG